MQRFAVFFLIPILSAPLDALADSPENEAAEAITFHGKQYRSDIASGAQ